MQRGAAWTLHLAIAVVLLLTAGAANGAVVNNLVGDKDCFGLGGNCADGVLYLALGGTFTADHRTPADPIFTDAWITTVSPTYTHAYSATGILSAVLSVRFAGVADNRGPWNVLYNGVNIGQVPLNSRPEAYHEVITYTWMVPLDLLTGADQITLGINAGAYNDGYTIDYSELSLTTEAVPEPGTLFLMGAGLIATALALRRAMS